MRLAGIAVCGLLGACAANPPPPGNRSIEGLPLTGDVAFARASGFRTCLDFNAGLRCRREHVRLAGGGPFSAAVDLSGTDGASGFRQLTLWSDRDQAAVTAVGAKLLAAGWTLCRTGSADRGDQNIYTRPGSRVRVSIDASYWGKRRLRILPEAGQPTGRCW